MQEQEQEREREQEQEQESGVCGATVQHRASYLPMCSFLRPLTIA
jgi:hypothetical protein